MKMAVYCSINVVYLTSVYLRATAGANVGVITNIFNRHGLFNIH